MADESGTREQLRENWRQLQARLDFALAQVGDRDLVIGSLREEKDTLEMERNMAEEAAALFKERAEAAEAKLAKAQKALDAAHRATDEQHREKVWAEAKLAEVEKELADSYKKNLRHAGVEDALRASMGRARELAEASQSYSNSVLGRDRFREIARILSGDEPDAVDKWLENKRPVKPIPLPPVDDLLSGDE